LDTSFLVAVEIAEHACHAEARRMLDEFLNRGDRFALAPQILAEFIHTATDPRRFQVPLTMETALRHSEKWWNAGEVEQTMPTDDALSRFHEWMLSHRLGRKRVLDTMLAATYRSAGVTSLLTLNGQDFTVFGEFICRPVVL
jgi:predicted nucleic acid-binding protein